MAKEKILERKEVTNMVRVRVVGFLADFRLTWKNLTSTGLGLVPARLQGALCVIHLFRLISQRCVEYEGFALLRVCVRFTDLDKVIFFHCLDKAKKLFKEVGI
jgi:hypothetical protein